MHIPKIGERIGCCVHCQGMQIGVDAIMRCSKRNMKNMEIAVI